MVTQTAFIHSYPDFVCLQMLLILTKSVNRCFEKNPKFDMAPLLGGTDAVFLSLIRAFSWSVCFVFRFHPTDLMLDIVEFIG